jgi:hypothetical protein
MLARMNEKPGKSRFAPVMITAVMLLAIPCGYAGAYSGLSKCSDFWPPPHRIRVFQADWQARIFGPAAQIEAKLKGVGVFMVASKSDYNRHFSP